jgi:hypothetical protein
VRSLWPKKVERLPQRWEYSVIEAHGPRNLGDALGVMGRNGWEAVGFALQLSSRYVVLLKRPANLQIARGKTNDKPGRT